MKLKSTFMTHSIDGTKFLVPVGAATFNGVVRSNQSAAFLVELLKEETSEEALVEAMCAKYDAPRETIAADVRELLDQLRALGAIEES